MSLKAKMLRGKYVVPLMSFQGLVLHLLFFGWLEGIISLLAIQGKNTCHLFPIVVSHNKNLIRSLNLQIKPKLEFDARLSNIFLSGTQSHSTLRFAGLLFFQVRQSRLLVKVM